MNGQPPAEQRWSPRRWVVTVAVLFAVQLGLTWQISDRAPLVPRTEHRPLNVRLAPAGISPELAALLKLNNPTRFVLPSREGFSGSAWLEVRPLQHRAPGWTNPPQWLRLKPEELLTEFQRFDATNQPARTFVSDRLTRPREPRIPLDETQRPKPATRLVITGELAPADLVSQPELPVIEHAGVLAPSQVLLWVDRRGRVFRAALAPDGSSGLETADRFALELAQQLKFVNAPGLNSGTDDNDFAELRRARVTIHWWTRSPPPAPATNAPAETPVPPPVQLQ